MHVGMHAYGLICVWTYMYLDENICVSMYACMYESVCAYVDQLCLSFYLFLDSPKKSFFASFT
jgi:hypothetical protein